MPTGKRGEAVDPARAEEEADRRARTALRRYCVANWCSRLVTLTYNDQHLPEDRAGVWPHVEDFRRRLRKLTGKDVPLAAVIERGEKSDRLHVHLALGEFVPERVLASAWRHRGWVDVRMIRTKGESKRERCRRAAGYLAAYLKKDWDAEERGFNRRRYSTTKGYRPVSRSTRALDYRVAVAWALAQVPGEIAYEWSSDREDLPPMWVAYLDP